MTSTWEFAENLWLLAETAVVATAAREGLPTFAYVGIVLDATSKLVTPELAATMRAADTVGMSAELLAGFYPKVCAAYPALFQRMRPTLLGPDRAWCFVSVEGRTEIQLRDVRRHVALPESPAPAGPSQPLRTSVAPSHRRVSPGVAHGHQHAEAFCVMHYRGEESGDELVVWNSRDGVTPFGFRHPVTGEEYRHVDFHRDRYAPDHKPQRGDYFFEDLTYERALARRRRFAVAHWDTAKDGWPALRDHYPGKTWEEAAEELARKDIEPPGRPTLARWGMEDA